jgi:hypothetical protein
MEEGDDGKYSKNGEEVRLGMATREAGRAINKRGGGGRYHLRGGVGGGKGRRIRRITVLVGD